ncbi:LOW QUALITY PROTEIN: hypothetical protein ACHAW5_000020 [Stephanodiscus triporus]|uniref:WW domain-containing protein n=1 Tax=Stephanodiscus triporus TaxID=2934178 RepID=A0ABD3RDE6_9STRA
MQDSHPKEQRWSNDSDACVPFLLDCHVRGDVSEITSPHFQADKHTFLAASLFSRISRGISDALSPASPVFDSPSTINAEDFLFEEQSVHNWNDHQRCHQEASASPILSSVGLTPGMRSQRDGHISESNHNTRSIDDPSKSFSHVDSTKNGPNSTEKKIVGEGNKNLCPTQIQRRVTATRADSIPKGKSVSWVISPSTQSPVSSKTSHPEAKNSDIGEDSNSSLQALATSSSSTRAGEDHWREVVDPESGRTYYYNRKTRMSKWRLPKGATLIKTASCRRHHQSYEPIVTADRIRLNEPLTPQRNHTRDEIGVAKLRHISDEDQSKSSQQVSTHQPTFLHEECQLRMQQQSASRQQNRTREESKLKSHGSEFSEIIQQSLPCQQIHSQVNFCAPADKNEKKFNCDQSYAAGETKLPHFKLPQDCTPDAVFCLYCGLKCGSTAFLGSHHLPQCDKFAYMQRQGLSTQIELESILFRAWSKIGSSTENCPPEHASSHRPITASEDHRRILTPSYHTSEDEDVKEFGFTFSKSQTLRKEADANANCFVEKKTCPFCDEVLTYGYELSSHLLKCATDEKTTEINCSLQSTSSLMERVCDPREANALGVKH